jgi:hypothetical protein
MYGLLSRNGFKRMVLFFCVPWVLLGCGDFDRDYGTSGADDSGSLFNIEYIDPTYNGEDGIRQVDVIQNFCGGVDEDPEPEYYSDHFANVTLSNRHLNNSTQQTASTIYVLSYEVRYQPYAQGSPPLETINVTPIGQYVGIAPCALAGDCEGETISGLEFVPIERKSVLGDWLIAHPEVDELKYNIFYTFFGENDFGYKVSAEGSDFFYAANYNNCN